MLVVFWIGEIMFSLKRKKCQNRSLSTLFWWAIERAFNASWDWRKILPHPSWIWCPASGFPLKMSLPYAAVDSRGIKIYEIYLTYKIAEKSSQKFPHHKLWKIKKQKTSRTKNTQKNQNNPTTLRYLHLILLYIKLDLLPNLSFKSRSRHSGHLRWRKCVLLFGFFLHFLFLAGCSTIKESDTTSLSSFTQFRPKKKLFYIQDSSWQHLQT